MRRRCAHSMGHGGDVAALPHSRTARPSPLSNLNRRRPVKECARSFRAQAVSPARAANMSPARRPPMRGANNCLLAYPTALGCRSRFGQRIVEARAMSMPRKFRIGLLASFVAVTAASVPAAAQEQQQKPNILFIMCDDIGLMQAIIYHR